MAVWACGSDPPGPDDFELSVFGVGVGEAIVVHLGDGAWAAVDSCVDADAVPVTLSYLRELGIPLESVVLVAASHWDTDHVRGLAELFRACPNAQFACAAAVDDDDVVNALVRYARPSVRDPGKRNIDHFLQILEELGHRGHEPVLGLRGTALWEDGDNRTWSLSPSSRMHVRSLVRLVANAARPTEDRSFQRRNHLSMAVWVTIRQVRVLLGGDLERTPGQAWERAVESPGRAGHRAQAYKASHHGAESGHDDVIWDVMLEQKPIVAVTTHSTCGLPTAPDVDRLRTLAGEAYLAGAVPTSPPRDPDINDLLASDGGGPIEPETGAVGQIRLRTKLSAAPQWRAAIFGNAIRL